MKKIWIYMVIFLLIAFAGNVHAMEVDILGGIDVHGFISQGYMESSDNNYLANNSSDGTFGFNEMGINFSKQLTDKLRIGLQIFSRDLGAIGNNDIVLDWAFADYRWKDWLGLRVGRIKAPHGLYNETRDIDMLRTSIFLPQSVYTELNRDTMVAINGLGVYGNVTAGMAGGFSYYLLGGTMDVDNDEGNGAVRQANDQGIVNVSEDFDFEEVYVAALEWQAPVNDLPFVDSLKLKWTYRTSDFTITYLTTSDFPFFGAGYEGVSEPDGRHAQYVYSLEYTWENLMMAFEFTQVRSELITNFALPVPASSTNWLKQQGYYISAAYRVNNWFETGAYYSRYKADSEDPNGGGVDTFGIPNYDPNHRAFLHDYALSLRFDINEYWVAKLEGHYMNGTAICLDMDNDSYKRHWIMWAAKLSFSF